MFNLALEYSTEPANTVDPIESLDQQFMAHDGPNRWTKKESGKLTKESKPLDPMLGFANWPITMSPPLLRNTPKSEQFAASTFDMELPNSPVTFSEYELNELGELTLFTANNVTERENFNEQIAFTNASYKALGQSNHSIPLVEQQAAKKIKSDKRATAKHERAINNRKKPKNTDETVSIKRRKCDENSIPNAIKILEASKRMHKIIIDKDTLKQMRDLKSE